MVIANQHAYVSHVFVYVADLATSREFYEDMLGLQVVEEDEKSVVYNVGNLRLGLNMATEYGVTLGDGSGSSLLVFHVDKIEEIVERLAHKGVAFEQTLRYSIGATATCFDPDGHSVTLYEPSEEALSWPSGSAYRRLVESGGGPDGISAIGLGPMIYMFLFCSDVENADNFYGDVLALPLLERDEEEGVCKYDCETIILATHPVDPEVGAVSGYRRPQSIAIVFRVDDVKSAATDILTRSAGKYRIGAHREGVIGSYATFHDPEGHLFYFHVPS